MPKVVDHEARRSEISGIVAGLIAQGGLEAATIREIARTSGYSKGVVEHYFDDKEELISAALAWVNRRYEERVNKATDGLYGVSALRKRIEATLPLTEAVRDEWKVRLVFWGMAAIEPTLRRQQSKRLDYAVQRFEQDLLAAEEHKEISLREDSASTARHLLNMTTGISTAALHQPTLYKRDFLLGEIDLLIDQLQIEQ
jgi:AcrR family transcriptional regulator